jgi:hypothetical protein
MLQIALDDYPKIEGDTPGIRHPEHLLHLILVLPNQALVGNNEDIIHEHNDCSDNCTLILKHEPSYVNM